MKLHKAIKFYSNVCAASFLISLAEEIPKLLVTLLLHKSEFQFAFPSK